MKSLHRPLFSPIRSLALGLLLVVGCRSPICPWCGHNIRQKPPQVTAETYLPAGLLEGTLTTFDHGALHPMARASVQLLDVTLHSGDDPILVAEVTVPDLHTLPASFQIPYPTNTIHTSHEYLVRASIGVGKCTLFTTDTRYPVLTHGAPSRVQLVLARNPNP